ncbi:MAG TPA: substrate-binding domain-containing protein [Terriglobales bacterium]|nr:substrate-binding domain-containing protein [Terriglobales bacterium]
MKKLSFALLAVENNDYQAEQVVSARATSDRLGVHLQVIHTEHDAIAQSERVLKLLQSAPGVRPDGILFEPVGTPLAQAARIAALSGVGWVVLNREIVDYLPGLRQQHRTPLFSVTVNHTEVGRIQGEQVGCLLPKGGCVLHIQGPADNDAAKRRTVGMQAAKPANVEVRALKGLWTEQSAYQSVGSWMRLSIAKELALGVVAAQNDAMALGARKAFQEATTGATRDRWRRLAFIGCDGLPGSGQAAVRRGLLAATVVIPANAGRAIEVLASALQTGQQPAECIQTEPISYPALASLKPIPGS